VIGPTSELFVWRAAGEECCELSIGCGLLDRRLPVDAQAISHCRTFVWVIVWPLNTIMFPTASGAITGFMNTFAQLAGAAAPIVSGFLIDRTGSYTAPLRCRRAMRAGRHWVRSSPQKPSVV
jgi:hypothetical protein